MPSQPVVITALLILSVAVPGPVPRAQQNRAPKRENVRCEGKITAVSGRVMQITGEGGEEWLVMIPAKPQDVLLRGSATPAFLRAGMLVQFSAMLDKRGVARRPITEIEVVSPRPSFAPGIRSEGGLEGQALFAGEADDEESKKRGGGGDPMPFAVQGVVRAIKDRQVLVGAGPAVVRGELAENCTISVEVSDYSLARTGDAVEVSGWCYANQPSQVHATNMAIVADRPLGGGETSRTRKSAVRRSGRNKGTDEGARSGGAKAQGGDGAGRKERSSGGA